MPSHTASTSAPRRSLKKHGVHMLSGVSYKRVDAAGLHIALADGSERLLEVDHVVVCAGQEPLRDLQVSACDSAPPLPPRALVLYE
jgi:2,4-dienoyl-CoA reductase (NADPH2)